MTWIDRQPVTLTLQPSRVHGRELTNDERADMVAGIVTAYHDTHYACESIETVVQDLITNLIHYAQRLDDDTDGAEVANAALAMFHEEHVEGLAS